MYSIDALTLTSKLTLSKLNTKKVGHEIHEQNFITNEEFKRDFN
jgi:hypothetical protein